MDHATKVLEQALAALACLSLGVGSRERAVELLRELVEHLEEGGYSPDLKREMGSYSSDLKRSVDTYRIGR